MRYIILVLMLLLAGCSGPPQAFDEQNPQETADDMSKYPHVQPASPRGVPQVAALTPRNGGWSGDNQLGYQAKYGPDQRGKQTILKMDEWGPPEIWTASLFVNQQLKAFNGFRITAEINFGAGGSTQTVEIDWVNGAQISLPMNAINVVAKFEDVDITTEGNGLVVGVQISRGARGGTRGPVKTIAQNIIIDPLSQSVTFEIPKFARTLYAVSTGGTANNINDPLVKLISLSGNFSADITGTVSGAQLSNGVGLPVVGSARFCRLSNGTAGPVNVTLFAEIDG